MKIKEDKFLVVKLEDLDYFFKEIAVNDSYRIALEIILKGIKNMRYFEGKKENKYIVVNEDELYSQKVWELILKE